MNKFLHAKKVARTESPGMEEQLEIGLRAAALESAGVSAILTRAQALKEAKVMSPLQKRILRENEEWLSIHDSRNNSTSGTPEPSLNPRFLSKKSSESSSAGRLSRNTSVTSLRNVGEPDRAGNSDTEPPVDALAKAQRKNVTFVHEDIRDSAREESAEDHVMLSHAREHIIRNKCGCEEPNSADPELWNIGGTEVDIRGTYKLGSQLWYLQARAEEAVRDGREIAGRPMNEKAKLHDKGKIDGYWKAKKAEVVHHNTKNKKFRWAVKMIMMSHHVVVQLRESEVKYYNSAFEIFDLDFDKVKQKPKKSEPSWMSSRARKFDPGESNLVAKPEEEAPEDSSDESDEDSDEDLSLSTFGFGAMALPRTMKPNAVTPATPRDVDKVEEKPIVGSNSTENLDGPQKGGNQPGGEKPEPAEHIAQHSVVGALRQESEKGGKEESLDSARREGKEEDEFGGLNDQEYQDILMNLENIMPKATELNISQGDRLCWSCFLPVGNVAESCLHCGADLFKKLCWQCHKPIKRDWTKCKHCGESLPKKRRRHIVVNPDRYMPKRLSILSFWEFKDEIRKMKLQWHTEAQKWGIRQGSPDTAYTILSLVPSYGRVHDRGAKTSLFEVPLYRSNEGLWDPADILLAPIDWSSVRASDYRSMRLDIAAKSRKIAKTAQPFVKACTDSTPSKIATSKDRDDTFSARRPCFTAPAFETRIRREESDRSSEFGHISCQNLFEKTVEGVLNSTRNEIDEISSSNLDRSRPDTTLKGNDVPLFALAGRTLPFGELLSQRAVGSQSCGPSSTRSLRYSSSKPSATLLSCARKYNERHVSSAQRSPRMAPESREAYRPQRPMTEGSKRLAIKEFPRSCGRGSWGLSMSDSSEIRQSTIGSGPQQVISQTASDVIVSKEVHQSIRIAIQRKQAQDRDRIGVDNKPSEEPLKRAEVQPSAHGSSVQLKPDFKNSMCRLFTASSSSNPFPTRPNTISSARSQIMSSSRPGQAEQGSHQPGNFHPMHLLSGISDSELISMCVKPHNRDAVALGLATPRRHDYRRMNGGTFQIRQEDDTAWVRHGFIEPGIPRDKERIRDRLAINRSNWEQKDNTTSKCTQHNRQSQRKLNQDVRKHQEWEVEDLFDLFADLTVGACPTSQQTSCMRMKMGGFLACLEMLGFLQRNVKSGRVAALKSPRRLSLMQALHLFYAVLDCSPVHKNDTATNSSMRAEEGLTLDEFESALQALIVRICRAESNYHPLNAAVLGSEAVENLLRKSSLCGRSYSPTHKSSREDHSADLLRSIQEQQTRSPRSSPPRRSRQ